MVSVCVRADTPGLPHSPRVVGQVGEDILEDLLEILVNLRTRKHLHKPTGLEHTQSKIL